MVVETAFDIAILPEVMMKARAKVAKDTVINEGVLQKIDFIGDRKYIQGGYCAPIPDELPKEFKPPPPENQMRGKLSIKKIPNMQKIIMFNSDFKKEPERDSISNFNDVSQASSKLGVAKQITSGNVSTFGNSMMNLTANSFQASQIKRKKNLRMV